MGFDCVKMTKELHFFPSFNTGFEFYILSIRMYNVAWNILNVERRKYSKNTILQGKFKTGKSI